MTTRKATRGQIGRITNMLASGQIPFEEAQRIIARETKSTSAVSALTSWSGPIDVERTAEYWEKRFPGQGARFALFIEPICDMKQVFAPPVEHLRERVRAAIFWRNVKTIIPMEVDNGGIHRAVDLHLGHSLGDRFPDRGSRNRRAFDDVLAFTMKLDKLLMGAEAYSYDTNFVGDELCQVLTLVAARLTMGDTHFVDQMIPLRDLHVAGNPPIGFTEKGNLIVAVRRAAPASQRAIAV